MRGDQLFRHADDVRRVAQHQQIDALVNKDILDLEHGLEHSHGLFEIGVLNVEAAQQQVLIFLLFGRGRRVDHDGVFGNDLLFQLSRDQDQVNGVFDAHLLHKNGDAGIGAYILVEDEIDAGITRQCFEHGTQAGVAELQGDRAFLTCFEHRNRGAEGHALAVDLAAQIGNPFDVRIEQRDFTQHGFRVLPFAVG